MRNTREHLCAWLRDPAPHVESAPADIIARARIERVHLLLADRLRLPELADDLRAATALEAAREHELRAVLVGLANAGVRTILLKGAAIARTHYSRSELRPRSDTDLMIATADRDATARALVTLGYHRPHEVDGSLTTGQFHFQKHDRSGLFHALDIHWRISNVRMFADVLTYKELARDAVMLPTLGPQAWGPSPVHALLIACVHRVAHHGESDCLLWLFDAHLLARALGPNERGAFTTLAASRGVRAVCASILTQAQTAFGGIDADWVASLGDGGSAAEPTAMFLGGGLRPIDMLKADLIATQRVSERLQLLLEHLFPSPAFMFARYDTRLAIALPFLYLHRAVSGLPKWFRH